MTRYIHLNPVRAGLVSLPEEYAWSSYPDYIHAGNKWKWLVTEETLGRFGTTAREKRNTYRRFVEDGLRNEVDNPLDHTIAGIVLGSKRFVKWVDSILIENGTGESEQSRCRRIESHSVEGIIGTVSRIMNVPVNTIRSRGRHDNRAREMAIYLAQKYGEETNAALGRVFGGITGSGISYMCCKVTNKLHHNRKLRRLLERLEHDLLLEA